jgi:aryl-alcohol dehydrogenase-like predicted oxidoreductase
MRYRRLGRTATPISVIGFGAMSLSGVYGAAEDRESEALLRAALDRGLNHIDTANVYGDGHNERLIAKVLADRRDDVVLATKFGAEAERGGGRPEAVRQSFEDSARRLGVDHIDLYYLHRVDPDTPIEDTIGAMADLVTSGRVGHLGLSEVNRDTLMRAQSIHPIAAVESEYSLFSREPEAGILAATAEIGALFVAYSPLGRGLLAGGLRNPDDVPADDWRRQLPRFAAGNFEANIDRVDQLRRIAADRDVTVAQLALAWLLRQGDHIAAITGTRKLSRLEENAAAADIELDLETLQIVDRLFPPGSAAGARADSGYLSRVDS